MLRTYVKPEWCHLPSQDSELHLIAAKFNMITALFEHADSIFLPQCGSVTNEVELKLSMFAADS